VVVRVHVRLKSSSGGIESIALANAGAEAEKPVVAIPAELAQELGLWPPP